MELDIIKLYEISRNDERGHLLATLHIRLPEIGLNIKGVHVSKRNDKIFIGLPNRKGFDKTTNKDIIYSILLFDEKEKNDAFIMALRANGGKYIEDYLKTTPQVEDALMGRDCRQRKVNSIAVKETASAAKAKPVPSILDKEWRDPPKRNSAHFKRSTRTNM